MFDLITGKVAHAPRPRTGPILVSMAAHAALVSAVIVGAVLFVEAPIPELPTMMAFVAPPPPPPPPPAPIAKPPKTETVEPVRTSSDVVPIEAPALIEPEPAPFDDEEEQFAVEGGVPGGIPGGVAGGLLPDLPPPPPPPPAVPPAPRKPLRVGGEIKEPALVYRVEPTYPAAASAMGIEGTVILEALVDEEGRVTSVRVLRSNGVFDRAALDAVRQWRYSPVLLNGRPEKFVLTVVVTFRVTR